MTQLEEEKYIKNLKAAIMKGTSISDYFIRFDKTLELDKILSEKHRNYACAHMGS